jgi:spermidine synthase
MSGSIAIHRSDIVTEAVSAHSGIYYRVSGVVETRRSSRQTLQILDTPGFGRVLRLDGVTMTSERDGFFYHENLVHVPAVAHPKPQDAVIIGGGDGGALREVLKHRCIERVSLVEPDPSVVEMSSRYLPRISQGAFRDARATRHFCDGRKWLSARDEHYDLLLLDLTDPSGAVHALYTAEFYGICRERLSPGGILALHVQSPVTRPHTFARIVRTLRSVFRKVRPYLVFVPTYGTWFAMATASMDIDPLSDTAEGLTLRLQQRGLADLRYYNPATHFAAFALPNFVLEILRADVPIVTDSGTRLDSDAEMRQATRGPDAAAAALAGDLLCNASG